MGVSFLSFGQTCRQESSDVSLMLRFASISLLLSPPSPPTHAAPLPLNRRSRTTAGWQPSTYANLAFRTALLVGSSRTTSRPTAYPPPATIAVSISPSLISLHSLLCQQSAAYVCTYICLSVTVIMIIVIVIIAIVINIIMVCECCVCVSM